MVSCGHTVGLNGVLWVYGFMGARWNWRGINNINLSQERRRRRRGRRRGARQETSCRVFAKKTIYIAKSKPSSVCSKQTEAISMDTYDFICYDVYDHENQITF